MTGQQHTDSWIPHEEQKREPLPMETEKVYAPDEVQGGRKRKKKNHGGSAPKQEHPPQQTTTVLQDFTALLTKLAAIALVILLLFSFMFGIHRSTEGAMAPAVKSGDIVIFYRLDRTYIAQDVIVLGGESSTLQTRRVVAVAGDSVDITEGGLMINGSLVYEPDIYEDTERYVSSVSFPLIVPEGQVFVLGDSREHSTDSRMYGCVEEKDTRGKVMAIFRRRGI